MKKVLIIGSTALDIIINVTQLPSTSEDVHISHQQHSLGGCAFNVCNMIRLFNIPNLFCSPVGTGLYGDYVAKEMATLGMVPFVRIPDRDNGCCYCYVEPSGERTFLSYHGAEYTFDRAWLDGTNLSEFDSVYVCGLEIEEPTGHDLTCFLETNRAYFRTLYFAPGPRIRQIPRQRLDAIFALSPVVHLNKDEILAFTGASDLSTSCKHLFSMTHNTVIVTDGENGAYCYDGLTGLTHAAGRAARVVDTIGAGDAHIGAVIAARQLGHSYAESLEVANRVAAKIVETKGALLPPEEFHPALSGV